MKLRVAFVVDVIVHGSKITKDDAVVMFVDWLYEQDVPFADSIADYVPEDLAFDAIELSIDQVSVK